MTTSTLVRTIAIAAAVALQASAAQAQASPPPPAPAYGPSITLDLAKRVAAAAGAEAKRSNYTQIFAIVDTGGNLVYFERLDNTMIASIEIAMKKAQSANGFKRSTKVFEDAVAGGRNAILGLPGAVPIEGGLPLLVDGKVVGAIGVSGGTAAQDGQVAIAGAAALLSK